MEKYNYKIYIPSGNPTALVLSMKRDIEKRRMINDEIMGLYSFIEQVGFINDDINNPELLMAGGEFCGNATRSAVYYYLKGKKGKIKIKVSGVKNILNAGIDKDNNVWVDMPIIKGLFINSIKELNKKEAIIKLQGITHVIIEDKNINNKYNKEELKNYSYNILKKYNLLDEPASGVMYINCLENKIELTPIVFVKDINTLFYETACGSGTVAVGLYMSYKNNKSVKLDVIQPTKEIINVETMISNKEIINARIMGKVIEWEV